MLRRIIDIIKSSNTKISNGTLFCNGYIIADAECIDYLENNNILENSLYSRKNGECVNLELSLAHLNSIGYYEDCITFCIKNKYVLPSKKFFIEEKSHIKSFGGIPLFLFANSTMFSIFRRSASSMDLYKALNGISECSNLNRSNASLRAFFLSSLFVINCP